jgi:hypothetical protein
MKRILPVVAAVTAFAAIGAAPARASQAAPAQPAQAAQVAGHQVSFSATSVNFRLLDANRQVVAPANSGQQFSAVKSGLVAGFQEQVLGHVNSPTGWPFSDRRFDSLYARDVVVQFLQQNGGGGCVQTDSVHSGVVDAPCGSHNAGTYWAIHDASPRGACTAGAAWLVNVGITNHYPVYPYGYAMFVNSNNFIYTQSHRPISGDDQWCAFG